VFSEKNSMNDYFLKVILFLKTYINCFKHIKNLEISIRYAISPTVGGLLSVKNRIFKMLVVCTIKR
jgi:hypothetical protein